MVKKIFNKRKENLFIIVGLMIIMLSVFVSAFAVSFPGKINIYPGGSIDKSFSIQNTMEPLEDITVRVTVEGGGDYVSILEGSDYEVASGETIPVKVRISVPANAKVGDIYTAKVLFETATSEGTGGGMVQFTTGHRKSFDIEVVSEPGQETPSTLSTTWIIVGIIVILLVIIVVWLIKKNQNSEPIKK